MPSVDRFGQDACDLLRQCPMFGCSAAPKGLLQFIRHICADEHSFAIGHFVRGLLVKTDATNGSCQRLAVLPLRSELRKSTICGILPCIREQVCKPNSVPDSSV